MVWNTKTKLGVVLAAAVATGASAIYLSQQADEFSQDDQVIVVIPPHGFLPDLPFALPDDPLSVNPFAGPGSIGNSPGLLPLPADPACPPASAVADRFQKAAYRGLAYGSLLDESGNFFLLTDKNNKKWAYIKPETLHPGRACVVHEGKSFQTAQPTGTLLMASAPASLPAPLLRQASFIGGENDDKLPLEEGACGDTEKILSWLNRKWGQSTVFKGEDADGKTFRVTAGKEEKGSGWTILTPSDKPGQSCVDDMGFNFNFREGFTPSFRPLR